MIPLESGMGPPQNLLLIVFHNRLESSHFVAWPYQLSIGEIDPMSVSPASAFGGLLRQLRKRAGMTQRDLAVALGYSDSLISSLEKGQRRPDLDVVIHHLIPMLGLQDDPTLATLLVSTRLRRGVNARHRRRCYPKLHKRCSTWTPGALQQRSRVARRTDRPQRGSSPNWQPPVGHSGRLVTLVGPPGVGKTTLALAAAGDVQVRFRDGALFVPLAAASDADQMAAILVTALAPGDASAKPPQTRLVELLRHRSLLLVLDNLEQIDGAGPLIAALLAACPTLTILATSRERLHLRAEQRLKVLPLIRRRL